jgi:hypothetical protein
VTGCRALVGVHPALYSRRPAGVPGIKIASRLSEENVMAAADGTWNLTMQTPMGDRKATLTVASSGTTLTGKQAAEGNSTDIFDGSVDGNAVAWKLSITSPMPMTLEFKGTVDGASMAGSMTAGAFGSWPFTGERA